MTNTILLQNLIKLKENFKSSLAQVDLVTKRDFDTRVQSLKRLPQIKQIICLMKMSSEN